MDTWETTLIKPLVKPHLHHLVSADYSILVDIIEPEAPTNFLLKCAFAQSWKKVHEVSKGDSSSVLPRKKYFDYSEIVRGISSRLIKEDLLWRVV